MLLACEPDAPLADGLQPKNNMDKTGLSRKQSNSSADSNSKQAGNNNVDKIEDSQARQRLAGRAAHDHADDERQRFLATAGDTFGLGPLPGQPASKRPQLARAETLGSNGDQDEDEDDDDYEDQNNDYQDEPLRYRTSLTGKQAIFYNSKPSKQQQQQQHASQSNNNNNNDSRLLVGCCSSSCCCSSLCRFVGRNTALLVPLVILSCMAAIYCLPFIEIQPKTPKQLPDIPFNFGEGPLRASRAESFKSEHLFYNQVHGAESIALDSAGNMYMAIEGGFVLYAHMNSSSRQNKAYYPAARVGKQPSSSSDANSNSFYTSTDSPAGYNLVKIAELNAIKQLPYEQRRPSGGDSNWRRECQLDEKVYGKELWYRVSMSKAEAIDSATGAGASQADLATDQPLADERFVSRVALSRCSKPLGVRLSADEKFLYVIDTLSGLYRVHLNVSDRQQGSSNQRLVSKLVDFRSQRSQLLPISYLDLTISNNEPRVERKRHAANNVLLANQLELLQEAGLARPRAYLNVSLRAVDDLVIDYGAGSRGSDIIYMTLGSQNWKAVSFVYDMLEGRPSGVVLRYDTGSSELSVLSPSQVSHVRTSILGISTSIDYNSNSNENNNEVKNSDATATTIAGDETILAARQQQVHLLAAGIGAPRLDENDIFDDRPLFFPNGIELTDDKQALLIADTANKRIIKHYIRGPRRGTSDLFAWTPHFPDNIRRGYDRGQETYWVVGCGEDTSAKLFGDPLSWLQPWPMLRKYILKNIYLFGYLVELLGSHVVMSESIRDFGYGVKVGHSLCQSMCPGMMILQYNYNGDIIRSIYSKEFPSDLTYYSQVSEIIDRKQEQHILYLGSPSYNYVTRLYLPYSSQPLN